MLDQIGKPEIIDLAILGATLLMGLAGFWRGVVKESLISAAVLLGYLLTELWSDRWANWIADQTSIGSQRAHLGVIVGTLAVAAIVLGYVGSTTANLPPADLPGRFGGLIVGGANAVFLISILTATALQFELDIRQRAILLDTRIAWRLANNFDWVLLSAAGVALVTVFAASSVRGKRAAIVSAGGGQRQGASGFQVRRKSALAPEAEKIDPSRTGQQRETFEGWSDRSAFSATVPLRRVPDPSAANDRPNGHGAGPDEAVLATGEVMRCVSCGERITENDRFCPRCGRLLIH